MYSFNHYYHFHIFFPCSYCHIFKILLVRELSLERSNHHGVFEGVVQCPIGEDSTSKSLDLNVIVKTPGSPPPKQFYLSAQKYLVDHVTPQVVLQFHHVLQS